MTRLTYVVLICAFGACLMMPGVATQAAETQSPSFIADATANRAWRAGERAEEIVLAPDGREPVLVLNKAAFRNDEITLRVETDGASIQLYAGLHRVDLRLLPDKYYDLGLNANPDRPAITFQRKPLRLQHHAWSSIANDDPGPTFSILFPEAKQVRVSFKARGQRIKLQLPQAPASATPTPVTPDPFAPVPPVDPFVPAVPDPVAPVAGTLDENGTMDAATQERVRRAVFRILIPTEVGGVHQVVPAFAVGKMGYAVTSLAPLTGASNLSAILTAGSKPVPAQIWSADVDSGLALVRIDPVEFALVGGISALPFQTEKPFENQPIWIAGPEAHRPGAWAEGRMVDGTSLSGLGSRTSKSLGYAKTSRWLHLSAAVGPDNAGGPVVNAKGEVVGIAAWTWQRAGDDVLSYALYADVARAMVEAMPANPVVPSLGGMAVPTLTFPTLHIQSASASAQLRSAANGFKSAAGQITDSSVSPAAVAGVTRWAKNLAEVAARVDPATDANVQADTAYLNAALRELSRADPGALAGAVNANASMALQGQGLPGQPVAIIGRPYTNRVLRGAESGTYLVGFQTTRQYFLFRRPGIQSEDIGSWVMAGGVLAGYVQAEDGARVPVIQQGFLSDLPAPSGLLINP